MEFVDNRFVNREQHTMYILDQMNIYLKINKVDSVERQQVLIIFNNWLNCLTETNRKVLEKSLNHYLFKDLQGRAKDYYKEFNNFILYKINTILI
jgi:hypothetical protein